MITNQPTMEKAKQYEGTPYNETIRYDVPVDLIHEYQFDFNTQIHTILDVSSLSEYGLDGIDEIGDYYSSRSELARLFYQETKEPRTLLKGAEPSLLVPYKEHGEAEFMFSHYAVDWQGKVLYAVYKFNTTFS